MESTMDNDPMYLYLVFRYQHYQIFLGDIQ